MTRLLLFFAALVAGTASPLAAQAAAPGDWSVASGAFPLLRPLPSVIDSSTWLDLEYDSPDSIRGLATDLDGDGVADLLVRSAPSLCGATGNCSYAIIDGRTGRNLGTVDGSRLYIRQIRIGGWPVIQTWTNMSVSTGLYSTDVFDGSRYVTLAATPVEGSGLERLFSELRAVPQGPSRPASGHR